MTFDNVKAELARKHMNAYELADRVGVTPVTFSNWMCGKTEPTISQAKKIAIELDCTLTNLFG